MTAMDEIAEKVRQIEAPFKRRIAELERQLADARKAAEWVPLTPQSKREGRILYWNSRANYPMLEKATTSSAEHLLSCGFTHYRSITAPPEPQAKEKP